jgi:hypothetical protein
MLLEGSETADRIRRIVLEPCALGLPCGEIELEPVLREEAKPASGTKPPIETNGYATIVKLIPGVTRAISIRQPYVEQILRGTKTEEYRSQKTNIRERVYLYASLHSGEGEAESWDEIGLEPGSLTTGLIVGSVEIVECHWDYEYECFAYALEKPERLELPLKPTNQPQPKFWIPQF